MSAKKWTTGLLQDALRATFPAPEYAVFFEVPRHVGGGGRRADAIAMGLWKSRGLYLRGFEIKAGRGDWLREKARPEKAESIAGFCEEWILVTAPGIAQAEEIPDDWGWMIPEKTRLKWMQRPRLHEPKPVDRTFLAALLRKANERYQGNLSGLEKEAFDKGVEHQRRMQEIHAKGDDATLARLQESVKEFEEASGISIGEWGGGNIGEAVKAAREFMVFRRQLAGHLRSFRNIRAFSKALEGSLEKMLLALNSPAGEALRALPLGPLFTKRKREGIYDRSIHHGSERQGPHGEGEGNGLQNKPRWDCVSGAFPKPLHAPWRFANGGIPNDRLPPDGST